MSLSPIIGAASQVLNLFSNSNKSTSPVDLSEASQLFSNLQNTTQFKQLTAQISSKLQTAAQSATSSEQSFLQHLADQFSNASQTGSTSALHRHHAQSPQSGVTSVLQNIYQQVQSL